jgi:ribosomal protein L20
MFSTKAQNVAANIQNNFKKMPRSVNHVASRAKRKKILKLTRGYYGARKNVWTVAKNTWEKGLTYAYRDRKAKKTQLPRIMDTTYQCRSSSRGPFLL